MQEKGEKPDKNSKNLGKIFGHDCKNQKNAEKIAGMTICCPGRGGDRGREKDKSLMFQECTIDLLGWDMDFSGVGPGAIVHPQESSGQVSCRCQSYHT